MRLVKRLGVLKAGHRSWLDGAISPDVTGVDRRKNYGTHQNHP